MANEDPTIIDPVTIKILIVADGRLRFDDHDFGLSLMMEGLHEKSWPIARFSITTGCRKAKEPDKIHQSNGEGADFPDIQFLDNNLRQTYDEIWIFGDHYEQLDENGKPRSLTTQLADSEAGLLRGFMQDGGGCFATGDHESLGAPVNAHLPRVRSMRVWHNGPPASGTGQNDTRLANSGSSEQDITPQKIRSRLYKATNSSVYPHPLLNGPTGAISVLPDHMHEGECRENQTAAELLEYSPQGDLKPLVIADSDSSMPPAHAFGAIGAYDGHLVGFGRIVVDASFHHFVNINLRGFSPRSRTYSGGSIDTGVYAYQNIRSYHQNIAVWLAPPEKQRDMYIRALWEVRWRSRVYGLLAPGTGTIKPGDLGLGWKEILNLGKQAREALEKLSTPALSFLWSIETFGKLTANDPPLSSLYPWLPTKIVPDASASSSIGIDGEYVIEYMIGGVMIAMARKFPKKISVTANPADQMNEILREGVDLGLKAYRSSLTG